MKNYLLILSLLFSFSSLAAVSIISDLDDTIKITEAGGNPTDIVGDDLYTGMAEFFQGAKTYSSSLYILSSSPSFMGSIIKSTLSKRGIEYNRLILRSSLTEGKFEYKVRKIKEIMESSSDDFVLIGDDLGKDPEVYAEIKKLYPSRVLSIYIHVVNARTITKEAIPYWTSFDLFLREHLESRMPANWVAKGHMKVRTEINMSYIFPKHADCPKRLAVYNWQLQSTFQLEAAELSAKLVSFCLQRQSDNNIL